MRDWPARGMESTLAPSLAHTKLWEGACPPIVVHQSCIGWLTHCHRGQALSHIWASVGFRFVCGIGQQEAWKAPWHPAWRVQNCGGLPPMVVYQSCIGWLTHCHRGQAPSHIWVSVGFRFVCGLGQQEAWKAPWHPAWRVQNCGGLPPMMVYQSCIGWLTHCHRGQALSHIWVSVGFRFVCGLGQQEA